MVYDSPDDISYYELVNHLEDTIHKTSELLITDIEVLAIAKNIRPTAILEELAITPGISISFKEGKVRWQPNRSRG